MIDVKRFTKGLIQFELEPNEFFFMLCLINNEQQCLVDYFKMFPLFSKEMLERLHLKSYIIIINPKGLDENLKLSDIIINPEFKEKYFIDEENAARELTECYFKKMTVNGKVMPARNIALYELMKLYGKIINGDIEKHKEIIEKTKNYVKKEREAVIGLRKYVEQQYWDILDDKEGEDYVGNAFME